MNVKRLELLDDELEFTEKTAAYLMKCERAKKRKDELIGKITTMKNGKTNPTLSNWRVIEDIDDIDSITAKHRPDE